MNREMRWDWEESGEEWGQEHSDMDWETFAQALDDELEKLDLPPETESEFYTGALRYEPQA